MKILYSQPVSLTIKTRSGYIQRYDSSIYFTPTQVYTLPEVKMKIRQAIKENKAEIIKQFRKRLKVLDFTVPDPNVKDVKEISVTGEGDGYIVAVGILLNGAVILEI